MNHEPNSLEEWAKFCCSENCALLRATCARVWFSLASHQLDMVHHSRVFSAHKFFLSWLSPQWSKHLHRSPLLAPLHKFPPLEELEEVCISVQLRNLPPYLSDTCSPQLPDMVCPLQLWRCDTLPILHHCKPLLQGSPRRFQESAVHHQPPSCPPPTSSCHPTPTCLPPTPTCPPPT